MRRIRDLLRLKYAQGLSDRATALSLGLSKGTVGNYLARFSQAGLSRPLPQDLDDDSWELLLFPRPTMASRSTRPVHDWAVIDRELRRPGVTRALLWEEYRAQFPDGFDLVRMNVEILYQRDQRLLALDRGNGHFCLECRTVIPARSSCHSPLLACSIMLLLRGKSTYLSCSDLRSLSYSPTLRQIFGLFKLQPAPADRFQCC
jgi:hypothetical protein